MQNPAAVIIKFTRIIIRTNAEYMRSGQNTSFSQNHPEPAPEINHLHAFPLL
jgi:hypothetical protein